MAGKFTCCWTSERMGKRRNQQNQIFLSIQARLVRRRRRHRRFFRSVSPLENKKNDEASFNEDKFRFALLVKFMQRIQHFFRFRVSSSIGAVAVLGWARWCHTFSVASTGRVRRGMLIYVHGMLSPIPREKIYIPARLSSFSLRPAHDVRSNWQKNLFQYKTGKNLHFACDLIYDVRWARSAGDDIHTHSLVSHITRINGILWQGATK